MSPTPRQRVETRPLTVAEARDMLVWIEQHDIEMDGPKIDLGDFAHYLEHRTGSELGAAPISLYLLGSDDLVVFKLFWC